jgi:hypothetical protein
MVFLEGRRGTYSTPKMRERDAPSPNPLAYVVVRIAGRTSSADLSGTYQGALGAQLMRSVTFPSSLRPGVWGAAIGAVAISVLGFSIFGRTLHDTAERMAKERAQTAVVESLTPICVERFRQQPDAPTKLKELAKAMTWDQRSIIEKGGWATMPGTDAPNSAVATACAERLGRSP